jgi:hypothetical protein
MADLKLSRRDVGRLLVCVRERRRKLTRGIAKFGDSFDPEQGANMTEGLAAFTALEQVLTEAMKHEDDHSRRDGRDPREHQGRRDAPGDYRPAWQHS